jgi:hypothetical protein
MNNIIDDSDVRVAHLRYLSLLNQYEQCKSANWIAAANNANIAFSDLEQEYILKTNYIAAMNNYKSLMRQYQKIKFLELYPPTPKLPKLPKQKVLSKKEAQSNMDDQCSICLEKHQKINTVLTSCGHQFGLICFNQWKNASMNQNQITKCPLCKQNVSKTCTFINRKQQVKIIDLTTQTV